MKFGHIFQFSIHEWKPLFWFWNVSFDALLRQQSWKFAPLFIESNQKRYLPLHLHIYWQRPTFLLLNFWHQSHNIFWPFTSELACYCSGHSFAYDFFKSSILLSVVWKKWSHVHEIKKFKWKASHSFCKQ